MTAEKVGVWRLKNFHLAAILGQKSLNRIFWVPTRMMRFHALQGVNENASTLEVVLLLLGNYFPFDFASRPEQMPHRTPRVLGVRPIVGRSILARLETWAYTLHGEVHDTVLVPRRFDGVCCARFVE